MSNLKALISLLRIKQWVKNIFVLSPFLISIELYSQEKIIMALIGFLSFSLISSFVYILNDVSDLNLDSLHPLKKKRPLPSGQISLSSAYVVSLILVTFGFLLLFFSEPNVFSYFILGFYILINIFYSILRFKDIPVIEFFIPAFGYPLRFLYGIILLDQPLSPWLYLVTFSFSIFLIIGKRFVEYKNYKDLATRKVLKFYSSNFLLLSLVISSNIAIFSWIAFTFSEYAQIRFSEYIWITSLLVTLGFLEYLRILTSSKDTYKEDPLDLVLKNSSIILISLVFLFLFAFLTLF